MFTISNIYNIPPLQGRLRTTVQALDTWRCFSLTTRLPGYWTCHSWRTFIEIHFSQQATHCRRWLLDWWAFSFCSILVLNDTLCICSRRHIPHCGKHTVSAGQCCFHSCHWFIFNYMDHTIFRCKTTTTPQNLALSRSLRLFSCHLTAL